LPFVPRAVLAARLDRVKGVDVLLEAWADLARTGDAPRLLVLGDGNQRTALEAQARRLGLASIVRFGGVVADAPARMAQESFYVAPSRTEGLPGSVVEAMALGLPVIATAVDGHHELLDDVAPEWLVPAEDPHAFAQRVRALLALPQPARDELSARLQRSVYERFAPQRVAAATLDVYRSAPL
jgi:glycosyltransferase involved in cell wall biosynthesis